MDLPGKIILGLGIGVFVVLAACIALRLFPLNPLQAFDCLAWVALITAVVMIVNHERTRARPLA